MTALAEEGETWVAWALAEAASIRAGEVDPPAQFVHLDDLASAVDLARRARLDGPYNVAPDGWIAGDTVRALKGAGPRLRLSPKVAGRLEQLRWRFRQGKSSVGLLSFAAYPWVVANDRLRAAGWVPRRTNEQAYVAGTDARWWTTLSPKRRQELSLTASAAVLALVGGMVTLIVRRAVRRARARRAAPACRQLKVGRSRQHGAEGSASDEAQSSEENRRADERDHQPGFSARMRVNVWGLPSRTTCTVTASPISWERAASTNALIEPILSLPKATTTSPGCDAGLLRRTARVHTRDERPAVGHAGQRRWAPGRRP